MIRISKLTDYAILILSHLAKDPAKILSAAIIADNLHLPTPTVSKILKMLAEAELVCSVRGVDGGYYLANQAENISVANIIAAMEGDFAMTECCESHSQCMIDSMCMVRENWVIINQLVHSLLTKITISDMLEPLSLRGFINGK